jgi:hypothetical protein
LVFEDRRGGVFPDIILLTYEKKQEISQHHLLLPYCFEVEGLVFFGSYRCSFVLKGSGVRNVHSCTFLILPPKRQNKVAFCSLYKSASMKTKNNVQNEKGDMQNMPGKASIPQGNENTTGVKNGVGIPNVASNKNNSNKGGNKPRPFSNERPIF